MSIRQINSSYQADFMKNGTRHRRSFDTEVEANAWEAEMKRRIALNISLNDIISGESKDKSLSDVLDETFDNVWEGQAQEQDCLYEIKKFNEYFGDIPARNIKTTHIDKFVKHLKKLGLKPATVNCKLAKLRKALNFALVRGWIDAMPHIPRYKTKNQRLIFWSDEEEQTIMKVLLKLANRYHNTAKDFSRFIKFFGWSIDTGLRPEESRQIHRKQVRHDKVKDVWVVDIYEHQTKTGIARTVPLTKRAHKHWEMSCKYDIEYPFRWWDNQRVRRHWDCVREEMNNYEKDFVFYITRHTCASRLVQRGVPITVVQKWMGHAEITTTMIYAKLAPDGLMVGLDALQQ